MNLYITREERDKLKKAFLNMRKQHVIAVHEIIENMGYTPDTLDPYASFLVNEEIKNQIRNVSRANRAHSIIYSNPDLNEEIVRFLVFYVNENTEIKDVVFLTEEHRDEDYYELFNGVAIFPAVKKVHIMECRMLESSLFRWIHSLPSED
jgi:hypothetical protein